MKAEVVPLTREPMTICQFCGTRLMERARFCYKCERELDYPDKEEPRASGPPSVSAMAADGESFVCIGMGSIGLGGEREFCHSCRNLITDNNLRLACDECDEGF